MKIVCSDAVSDRAEMWSKVVSEFKVGDKLTKTVGKVSDIYGVFFELLPGFDALAHISNIRGLGGRRPSSVFETGQELPVQIIEIDERRKRVQLTVDASELDGVEPVVRPIREPAYKVVELWSMNNPEKAQAAEDWLREQTKDAPMHGSRLGELVKRFADEARIERTRLVRRDPDEPFFPVGLYTSRLTEEVAKDLSDAGFNCAMPYGATGKRELDIAERHGLKICRWRSGRRR